MGKGEGRKKKKREDDGISGCRCVSFGLAVTSCFHTITNTAHPLTLHHHQNKKRKKKNVGRGDSYKEKILYYLFLFLMYRTYVKLPLARVFVVVF